MAKARKKSKSAKKHCVCTRKGRKLCFSKKGKLVSNTKC